MDTFDMPEGNLYVIDFVVELYKCQKADYLYENVQKVIDDIKNFLLENGDAL